MKVGTRVRLSDTFRAFVATTKPQTFETEEEHQATGYPARLREFDNCVGVVLGPTFPGDDPEAPDTWIDVRWEPSGLRYAYLPEWVIEEKD